MMNCTSKQGLEFRRMGNEGIILDTETAAFYRLQPAAADAWQALMDGAENVDLKIAAHFRDLGLIDAAESDLPVFDPVAAQVSVQDTTFTVAFSKNYWVCDPPAPPFGDNCQPVHVP